jgi:ribosome recycling factor
MVIQPWDKLVMDDIQKAILKANIGLTPINDGKVIRISIPALTEDRRKELAKICHRVAEEGKVSLRNSRRDAREKIKAKEKAGELSEDDAFKSQADMDKRAENFSKGIDRLLQAKEKELLEI